VKVAVIGLGKLGIPMAAFYAEKGHDVIGSDIMPDLVDSLKKGTYKTCEPGVEETLQAFSGIKFTTSIKEAVEFAKLIFVVVPTPSEEAGDFSDQFLVEALYDIGEGIKCSKEYKIVVVVSTIMPGTMEQVVIPTLEEVTEKSCYKHFGVCYNPEFIALGSVMYDMDNPDVVLIGSNKQEDAIILQNFHISNISGLNACIHTMSFINSEIAKLALNCAIVAKISVANTIASVCEAIEGGDATVVTEFIGDDSRIGHAYFKPGLGYSGPCFPRDPRAFIELASEVESVFAMQEACEIVNNDVVTRIVYRVMDLVPKKSIVSILGTAYKTDSGVIEESCILQVANILVNAGYKVHTYDPIAICNSSSIEECLQDSELCIVATEARKFKDLNFDTLSVPRILDCWGIYREHKDFIKSKGIEYCQVGVALD